MNAHRWDWRYRANVGTRALAGTVGSYAVAGAVAALCARVTPLDRAQASMLGMLVGLVAVTPFTLWAFLTRSAMRACAGAVLMVLMLAVLACIA